MLSMRAVWVPILRVADQAMEVLIWIVVPLTRIPPGVHMGTVLSMAEHVVLTKSLLEEGMPTMVVAGESMKRGLSGTMSL
jgi:hypothetical protein